MTDTVLDLDGCYIQCATHDARFRIHDGYCVAGPCAGERLRALRLRVTEDGRVVLAVRPSPWWP